MVGSDTQCHHAIKIAIKIMTMPPNRTSKHLKFWYINEEYPKGNFTIFNTMYRLQPQCFVYLRIIMKNFYKTPVFWEAPDIVLVIQNLQNVTIWYLEWGSQNGKNGKQSQLTLKCTAKVKIFTSFLFQPLLC